MRPQCSGIAANLKQIDGRATFIRSTAKATIRLKLMAASGLAAVVGSRPRSARQGLGLEATEALRLSGSRSRNRAGMRETITQEIIYVVGVQNLEDDTAPELVQRP